MRLMCLFTLLISGLLARPALAQQTDTKKSGPTEIARTTDDLRERMLMDRIDELEKRIADLEERGPAEQPAATVAAATPATAPDAAPAAAPAASPAPQTTPAPAPTPAAAPSWSVGPVDIGGAVDGYYNFNTNHPANRINGLQNFNTAANQFDLSLAKISLSHDADPIGFRVDFGYGKTMQIVNSLDPNGFNQYVEQAYVTMKPGHTGGLTLDFGKFVTTAGAEVIESYTNWNYSHSLLFSWAIPYYHFGLRASEPIGKHWAVGAQLVNGWNNVTDNNSGKTVGLNATATYSKVVWVVDWYGGPENNNDNTGWRNLIDTTVTVTPWSKLSAYINYDYGQNRNPTGVLPNLARWQGVAAAIHWQATPKWAFTPRGEWFDDYQGFETTVAQQLKEFTLTGEYKIMKGLMWRAEYRYDVSNKPFFMRGALPCHAPFGVSTCPASFGLGNAKTQNLVTIGVVGYFGH